MHKPRDKKLLDGEITILCDNEGAQIEIRDELSGTKIVTAYVNADKFVAALGRLSSCSCDIDVTSVPERIGKKHRVERIVVKFPREKMYSNNQREIAEKIAIESCPEGWKPDLYFNSQDSFPIIDGVQHVKFTIRRWE